MNGPCPAGVTAAAGTWTTNTTWMNLNGSAFDPLVSANATLFAPVTGVFTTSPKQACVVNDTNLTLAANQAQTIPNLPAGTYAIIASLEDATGDVQAAVTTLVSITSGATATATLTLAAMTIDVPAVASTATATSTATTAVDSTKLAFLSPPINQSVTDCSLVMIATEDANGDRVATTGNLALNVTSSSTTGHFYTDAACAGAASSPAITAGSSAVTLYYKDTTAGSPTLTAVDSAGALAAVTLTGTVLSSTAPRLVFSNAALTQSSTGCGALTIGAQNGPASGAVNVTLSSSSTSGSFYSDAACTQKITSATLPISSSTITVYYEDATAGTPVLTAASTGATLASATQMITIGGGAATALVFTNTSAQTVGSSNCFALGLELQDGNGTPTEAGQELTFTLTTTSSSGHFYAGLNCVDQITSVTFPANISDTTIYYSDSSAGSPTLTATGSTLPAATTTLQAIAGSEPLLNFGGMYGGPNYVNVATGASSCPAGYIATQILGTANFDYALFFCWQVHVPGGAYGPLDFGGMYGAGSQGAYVNPATGSSSCPAGFTAQTVLGATNVDNAVHVCTRTHVTGSYQLLFGGAYGQGSTGNYVNPMTQGLSCPGSYKAAQFLGSTGLDYPAYFCYE
jgi:hypothetical protein